MGLDMYLEKATLVKEENPENLLEYSELKTVMEKGICWRKAYAIMDWFETNLGQKQWLVIDFHIHNCALYPIYKDDLKKLKSWCERFVANPDLALNEINKHWYEEQWIEYEINECKRTVKLIDDLINDESIDYFLFHGWW